MFMFLCESQPKRCDKNKRGKKLKGIIEPRAGSRWEWQYLQGATGKWAASLQQRIKESAHGGIKQNRSEVYSAGGGAKPAKALVSHIEDNTF